MHFPIMGDIKQFQKKDEMVSSCHRYPFVFLTLVLVVLSFCALSLISLVLNLPRLDTLQHKSSLHFNKSCHHWPHFEQ